MPHRWPLYAILLVTLTLACAAGAMAQEPVDGLFAPEPVVSDQSVPFEERLHALQESIEATSPGDPVPAVAQFYRLIRLELLAEQWGPGRFDPAHTRNHRLEQLARRLEQLRAGGYAARRAGDVNLLLATGAVAGATIRPDLEVRAATDLLPGAVLVVPTGAWPDPAWLQARVAPLPDAPSAPGMEDEPAPAKPAADVALAGTEVSDTSMQQHGTGLSDSPSQPVRFSASRTFVGWEVRLESGSVPAGTPIMLKGAPVNLPLAPNVTPEVWLRPDPASAAARLSAKSAPLEIPEGQRVLVDSPTLLGTGQRAWVGIRVVDALGRPLAPYDWPNLDVLVNGAFRERLDGNTGLDVVFAQPGIYRLELRSGGGGTRGVSEPIVVRHEPDFDLIWQSPFEHLSAGLPAAALGKVVRYVVDEQPTERGGAVARLFNVGSDGTAARMPFERIAVAAPAFDERGGQMPQYLQPLQGGGAHLWYVARVAGAGYRFGLLQAAEPSIPGRASTAFLVPRGQASWIGTTSTYVTTGSKPFVDVRVNGELPGARAPFKSPVEVTAEVAASQPVREISVVKNGRSVYTFEPQVADAEDAGAQGVPPTLELTFNSESAPWLGQRDSPRNGREWIGFVKVSGGTINGAHLDGAGSPRHAARLDADAGRIDFLTWSHGIPARLKLDLDRADEGVTIELAIREGLEDDAFSPRYRPASPVAGGRYLLGFDEISAGATRVLRSAGYEDTVTLQLRSVAAPLDAKFRWEDQSQARAGDFYWVSVLLADGTRVWTTPVWNGDFDPVAAGIGGTSSGIGTDR